MAAVQNEPPFGRACSQVSSVGASLAALRPIVSATFATSAMASRAVFDRRATNRRRKSLGVFGSLSLLRIIGNTVFCSVVALSYKPPLDAHGDLLVVIVQVIISIRHSRCALDAAPPITVRSQRS
jgi:hypothetical protein